MFCFSKEPFLPLLFRNKLTFYPYYCSEVEPTQKEITQLKHANLVYKKDKQEWILEKEKLEEGNRKWKHTNEKLEHRTREMEESYEKRVRELEEGFEKVRKEREELKANVKNLTTKLNDEQRRQEDAEENCKKWKSKYEHLERENLTTQDEIQTLRATNAKDSETITKITEEKRSLAAQKKKQEEDYHQASDLAKEYHRQITAHKETIHHMETTIKEKTELIHTHIERIKRLEGERDTAENRCRDLDTTLSKRSSTIHELNMRITNLTSECDALNEKCAELEDRCDEMYEEFTETTTGSTYFEAENEKLLGRLSEACKERDDAILTRTTLTHQLRKAEEKFETLRKEMETQEASYRAQNREHVRNTSTKTTRRSFRGGMQSG